MFESILGIKITHIAAGVAGGAVRALLMGGGWMAAFTAVLIGSLTAAYFTTPAYYLLSRYTSIPQEPSTEHAVGFLVGLTAMMICEGFLKYARGWSRNPTLPGGKP